MSGTKKPNEFKMGLALAGAISAGAYTAGVIDFLVQALEEWEAARGDPAVPEHRTGLKVITGASAGAITGALGLIALSRRLTPQQFTAADVAASHREPGKPYQSVRCVLPQLYKAWVTQPRLVSAVDGQTDLLSEEDLTPEQQKAPTVGSVLNAKLLDQIRDAALDGQGTETVTRPYLAEPLHVYMTVSNLRGIPFRVKFGNAEYGMQTHGDRVHYTVSHVGGWICPDSTWLAADRSMPLDASSLPTQLGGKVPKEWTDFGTAALASAAFPIGLASREITAQYDQYEKRMYPLDVPSGFINPWLKIPYPASGSYRFLNVDGGLINNSPFEYAEYALMERPSDRPKRAHPDDAAARQAEARETNAAVIMVAPFPEPPALVPENRPQAEVLALVRALIPTLINQVRFKPGELAQAMDPDNYSRYLVAPHRVLPGRAEGERYTIACGSLSGFGGFLDEKFRAHDFQLGRRNCQQFLLHTFNLPVDAPAINPPDGARQNPAQGGRPATAPVIPLQRGALPEVPLPEWPRMSQTDLTIVMDRVTKRLNAVLPVLVNSQTSSTKLRLVGKAAMFIGKGKVIEYVRFAVLSDLIRRDQLAGWTLPADLEADGTTVRGILAELAGPSFDYRTAEGIAASMHADASGARVDPAFVAKVLRRLTAEKGNLRAVTAPGDDTLFTLQIRQPGGFWSLPGVSAVGRWLDPPSNDRAPAPG